MWTQVVSFIISHFLFSFPREISVAFDFLRTAAVVDEMESEKYLPELMAEKDTLDPSFQHSLRLLEQGKSGALTDITSIYSFIYLHSIIIAKPRTFLGGRSVAAVPCGLYESASSTPTGS